MQTNFTADRLADPEIALADKILRSCVHCGFCNATCPTYLLTGDERDGPRGRIYMIRDMLQEDRPPDPSETYHLDRCLSCFSCMTTCPASVDYRHLIDPVRARLEAGGRRRAGEVFLRRLIGWVLPRPGIAAALLHLGRVFRPVLTGLPGAMGRLFRLIPSDKPAPPLKSGVHPAEGARKYRVILLPGCIQQPIAPEINQATIRLLTRLGAEVIIAEGGGCCGSLDHHLGRADPARRFAAANLRAWKQVEETHGPADAIISNATGCGAMLRDYGHLFADDPEFAGTAGRFSTIAEDISTFVQMTGIENLLCRAPDLRIAWQAPCSLSHGHKPGAAEAPPSLLAAAGFDVIRHADEHICCGSAGTYNILQGALSDRLKERKSEALSAHSPDAVATANIGCLKQLSETVALPVLHVVELLDWATGGPPPEGLKYPVSGED